MARRAFAELLRLDRPALGTWSQMAAPEMIDMLGAAGLDFTIVDCEHGPFGLETAENLFRACDANGLMPLVRAPQADALFVSRALDAGAAAVIVPGVASAVQAQAMAAAARFAPEGTRGACPCVRSGNHFVADWGRYAVAQHASVGVIALVETADGLAAIEAICATDGLLALMIGPFDLSVSLGFDGDYRRAEVSSALERMIEAARANDLPVIAPVFANDLAEARRQRDAWAALGVRLFTVGTDKILFADAAYRYAAALR